jgi:hypothetical protein
MSVMLTLSSDLGDSIVTNAYPVLHVLIYSVAVVAQPLTGRQKDPDERHSTFERRCIIAVIVINTMLAYAQNVPTLIKC